jgi:hypothetical protein
VVGGAGGADTGGAGGEGGTGGSGGAGGDGELTLAEACAGLCAVAQDASLAVCRSGAAICEATCTGVDSTDPDNYLLMVQCLATLITSQWECSSVTGDGTLFGAIPVADGDCETDICIWTCNDKTFADASAIARCSCV